MQKELGAVFPMFTLVNIGERAGSGLFNIFSVWKQQNWDTPILSETFNPERTTLRLIMDKSADIPDKSADIREPIRKYHTATEEQRTRILEFLHTDKTCSNADVCLLLDVKETRAKTLLSQMVDDGLLVAEGEKKGRVYRIRGN